MLRIANVRCANLKRSLRFFYGRWQVTACRLRPQNRQAKGGLRGERRHVIPPAMRDTDDEIREIKTEIIESRGLVIKTNNLTNSLAADIKSIARRQAVYERRFTLNSAVAYVLFATLSFVGLKLWSDVRIN